MWAESADETDDKSSAVATVEVPPVGENETPILNLVDDCFFELFNWVSIVDLCALRDTCTDIRRVVDEHYKKLIKTFQFTGEFLLNDRLGFLSMDHAKSFMKSFGHLQVNAIMHADAFLPNCDFDELLLDMSKHWTALCDYKMVKIDVSVETIELSDRLFSNLHRLVIDKCLDDNRTFSTCLAHCKQLKDLELIRLFNIEGNSFARAFPHLESFSIKSSDNINYEFLLEFIAKNPQLKKLKLIGCNFVDDQIFKHIAEHLPNLESLSLRMVYSSNGIEENLMHLLRLPKLAKLEINCGIVGVNNFLNGLVANQTMESLHLSSAEVSDETVQILCNLKSLKVLKFTSTLLLDKTVCKSLASSLPLLTELHILECASTSFEELLEFVKHSPGLNKLVYLHQSEDPSLNKSQFLDLVAARQCQQDVHLLNVYLDYFDHRNIKDQMLWEGCTDIFDQHIKLVRLLPLDDEDDRSTAFDYGCGNSQKTFRMV